MALFCVFSWVILPVIRFIAFLATSSRLQKNRPRAIAVSVASFMLIGLFLYSVPFPKRFLAPGVVESSSHQRVVNHSSGQVAEVLVATGTKVAAGEPLLSLRNPELDHEKQLVMAQREELRALMQQNVTRQSDNTREMLEKRLATLNNKLADLERQRNNLLVKAEHAGTWVSPHSHELPGRWLSRGSDLGSLVTRDKFRFTAVVSQEEAANLFNNKLTGKIDVRLNGQSQAELAVIDFEMIPFQHERLPSAALGWGAGGDIPVSGKDEQGLQTVEPFFRISADLDSAAEISINHGHSGQIRFELEAEPLLQQLLRKTRQFLQKRYQT